MGTVGNCSEARVLTMAKHEFLDDDSSSWDLLSAGALRDPKREAAKRRNILVIENDDKDYAAIERCVRQSHAGDLRLHRAVTLADGFDHLARGDTDVVLLDLGLPDSQGLDTLQKARSRFSYVPIIVLTGVDDADTALQAVRQGAQDYLAKERLDPQVLVRSIRYSIVRNRYRARLAHLLELSKVSASDLKNIITGNADGMVVVDENGLIRFSNPAAEVLLGQSSSELTGAKFGYSLTPGAATEIEMASGSHRRIPVEMRAVELTWEGKTAYLAVLHDLTLQRKAEEELRRHREHLQELVENRTTELAKANEELRREIAERRRAEEALKRSECELAIRNRIAEVFLTVPDDEMYAEVLKLVLEALDSEYGVFGYIAEDGALVVPTMTRTVWDKCQVLDKDIVFPRETWGESIWPRAIRQKETLYSNEPSTLTPEGHVRILRNISSPIIDQGEVIGLFQVANRSTDYDSRDVELLEMIGDHIAPILNARLQRDIQHRARAEAERELRKHRDRLEKVVEQRTAALARSNTELEQFATVVSHDLQEPLRTVRSYLELLQTDYGDKLGDEADEFIGYAVEGSKRMQQMIRDLLSYSRVSTRGKPFEPADLNGVVDEVKEDLHAAIREHNATVTRGDLPTIPCDRLQLAQLFQNLVSNAIKFHGQEPPKIHIAAEPAKDSRAKNANRESAMGGRKYCTFSIQDNGIGMNRDHHDRVFEVFQRLHTREEYPGTGIGLAICKKIIDRHGGRIWFESEPGKGTTFRFTLPETVTPEPDVRKSL